MQDVVDHGSGDTLVEEGTEPPLQRRDDAVPEAPGGLKIEPHPAARA